MKNTGIYLLFVVGAIAACTNEKFNEKQENEHVSAQVSQAPLHTATLDSKKVCMVNNAYMGKPQIPVSYDEHISAAVKCVWKRLKMTVVYAMQ